MSGYCEDDDCRVCGKPKRPWAERHPQVIMPLSERELEVLALLGTWLQVKEIGVKLGISDNTAKCHVRLIYQKLGVHTRRDAVARARALGLGDTLCRDCPARLS